VRIVCLAVNWCKIVKYNIHTQLSKALGTSENASGSALFDEDVDAIFDAGLASFLLAVAGCEHRHLTRGHFDVTQEQRQDALIPSHPSREPGITESIEESTPKSE
jgi:hypothetical protein